MALDVEVVRVQPVQFLVQDTGVVPVEAIRAWGEAAAAAVEEEVVVVVGDAEDNERLFNK